MVNEALSGLGLVEGVLTAVPGHAKSAPVPSTAPEAEPQHQPGGSQPPGGVRRQLLAALGEAARRPGMGMDEMAGAVSPSCLLGIWCQVKDMHLCRHAVFEHCLEERTVVLRMRWLVCHAEGKAQSRLFLLDVHGKPSSGVACRFSLSCFVSRFSLGRPARSCA